MKPNDSQLTLPSGAEQEVVKKAIAKASSTVIGVGSAAQTVISVEIAEALAIALAEAMAEVFCP